MANSSKLVGYMVVVCAMSSCAALTFPAPTTRSSVFPVHKSMQPLRMAEEQTTLDPEVDEDEDDRLKMIDERTGRVYDRPIEELCEEEYCAVNEAGQKVLLSMAEKERIFVDAVQSYYYDNTAILTDTEFDKLQSDLSWEGSKYSTMTEKEGKLVAAVSAYKKGEPIMTDDEFDKLKDSLRTDGSLFAVDTEPQCFLEDGVCAVTYLPDKTRMLSLYAPGTIVATLFWLGVIFEVIEPIRAFNPLLLLILGTPYIFFAAKYGTEKVWLQDPLIVTGPCPSCTEPQRVYFGNVAGVEGFQDEAQITCKSCKKNLIIDRETLKVTTKMD
eukprot:CAMPEP_0113935756 /NCGR_PEP_ID=MMETSP1339-20121228/2843_1 /TAXON_ID=94617 /ORGANISM="Fibrocapsa japonica" /LENGTH=326 /DNA_ID=CAMNT_0000938011 /DNA_START=45 /DNA_END=1025 /DNA_ORIENTATION=- /assembly_acc=CAM_ASM_000762